MVGWLVIVLRRHAEALHELSTDEFMELGRVLELTVRALHGKLGPAKEYAACYAEAKGFEHIHFHVVPRARDMPEELLGAAALSCCASRSGMLQTLRQSRPSASLYRRHSPRRLSHMNS